MLFSEIKALNRQVGWNKLYILFPRIVVFRHCRRINAPVALSHLVMQSAPAMFQAQADVPS
jgi:hypothetical protein